MYRHYRLPQAEADRLVDEALLSIMKAVFREDVPIEEQHQRMDDILNVIRKSRGFGKPKSKLNPKRIQNIAGKATSRISITAKKLSREIEGDSVEKEIAFTEYRQQLTNALVSRLLLAKTQDQVDKWTKARKVAMGVAVGATAIGVAAILTARHLKRGEEPKDAYERGKAEEEERERERLEKQGQ